MVGLEGYGGPAWNGGPMFWADTIGLDAVLERLERFSEGSGISPHLREKAASGGRFTQ